MPTRPEVLSKPQGRVDETGRTRPTQPPMTTQPGMPKGGGPLIASEVARDPPRFGQKESGIPYLQTLKTQPGMPPRPNIGQPAPQPGMSGLGQAGGMPSQIANNLGKLGNMLGARSTGGAGNTRPQFSDMTSSPMMGGGKDGLPYKVNTSQTPRPPMIGSIAGYGGTQPTAGQVGLGLGQLQAQARGIPNNLGQVGAGIAGGIGAPMGSSGGTQPIAGQVGLGQAGGVAGGLMGALMPQKLKKGGIVKKMPSKLATKPVSKAAERLAAKAVTTAKSVSKKLKSTMSTHVPKKNANW